MKRRWFLLLPLMPAHARAHSYRHGDIAIGHAWALPARSGDGQVFVPMANTGKVADALVAARSNICSYIELRVNNHYVDPAEERFELVPGKPFAMRPTAKHLRLTGLNRSLDEYQTFTLILDFERAGEVEIEVEVESTASD